MFQLLRFPLAVRIAALTVAIGPLLAISADARGPGGGGGFHGGGGFAGVSTAEGLEAVFPAADLAALDTR